MPEMYLDANAHIPINQKALKAYIDFSSSKAGHGHPSSLSEPGRLAGIALEEARAKIAQLIGANSASQIVFTHSCSQACEWGLRMFLKSTNRVYVSPVEHPAVKDVLEAYSCSQFEIDSNGIINFGDDEYKQAVCIHMQNETGIIYPIEQIKTKKLFSDMSQSLGKIEINVSDLNVDMAVFGAHKFGGMAGVGFIYLKDPSVWSSFGTGSRYFMDRPGTPDVAGIVASAVALEEAIKTLPERQANMISFQKTLEAGLEQRGYEIIGKLAKRSPNTTFVNVPNKAMIAIMQLGEKGIHVGLGSACGSMHAGPSPLMKVLGRKGSVHDYLRISQWGEYTDKDAQYFLDTLDSLKL